MKNSDKKNRKFNRTIIGSNDVSKTIDIKIPSIVLAALLLLSVLVFKSESVYVIKWYIMFVLIGLPALPFSHLFSKFSDKGYVFTKMISLSFSAMFLFVLSSFRIMKYTVVSCYISVLIIAVIMYAVAYLKNSKDISKLTAFENTDYKTIIAEECVILFILIMMMYIRAFAPSAYGTEKFMDYGFMTSMMRTEYFPPEDFWFSGTNLNYYFLGQYFATFLTKLSFNKVEYTYNLMTVTLCALSFVGVYSITSTLMKCRVTEAKENGLEAVANKKWNGAVIAGIISAIAACFMGNMHFVFYKFVAPFVNVFIRDSYDSEYIGRSYWYPDATRYIGYHPDTNDKTIHEFPIYSFILNDLHAHVCNLVLVVTVIAILLAYALKHADERPEKISFNTIINPTVLLVGFYLGIFQGANFWDFPIYFVTAYAVIMFVNMRVYGIKLTTVIYTVLQAAISLLLSKIVIFAFTKDFEKMMSGIGIVAERSMLHQLIILWGLPFAICIAGMVYTVSDYKALSEDGVKKSADFDTFMHSISISDFFMFIIACCAMGLILMPELVYVKDIYGDGYSRSNTMFKLVYQAFFMFGICTGYIVIKALTINVNKNRKKVAIVFLILLAGCSLYFFEAVHDSCGNIFNRADYKGINALYFLENDPVFASDKEVCDYINENIKGQVRILEANGYSYTEYNRMSVATGMPTIVGWRTHEWLWKNDVEAVDKRATDVQRIYTSGDVSEVKTVVNKYGLDYIYIGELERKKYEDMGIGVNTELLLNLYEVEYMAFPQEGERPSYLLKVK